MTNRLLESTILALQSALTVTPEFPPESATAQTKDALDELVREYPVLLKFEAYLNFLRITGGAHIHNNDVSLGIYGFGGYVVTSFEEGSFLDKGRYFHFGEVLYHQRSDPVFVLAFDFAADTDLVLTSPIEESRYVTCASSFIALLDKFARGAYPNTVT